MVRKHNRSEICIEVSFFVTALLKSSVYCGVQQRTASCPTCRTIRYLILLQSCKSKRLLLLKSLQGASLTLKPLLI